MVFIFDYSAIKPNRELQFANYVIKLQMSHHLPYGILNAS